jgi:GH24 family phage-related lysozyme (muramidase)
MGLFDIISKPLEPSQLEQPVGWGTSTEDWDYTLEMDNYIQKLKLYENARQIGYSDGSWTPHDSLEGGTRTVGYGHKLGPYDDPNRVYSEEEVDSMLVSDVFNAYRSLRRHFRNSKYDWNGLTDEDKVVLTELLYNTGNSKMLEKAMEYLGSGEDKKDYTSLKELISKRGYRDTEGKFHPLTNRNEDIIQSYLRR